ncbi:DUF1294 domain-containing protein [Deinococcus malanensis]|nr:DUF1294 domain-containing protein [Deinococcus malanensis]
MAARLFVAWQVVWGLVAFVAMGHDKRLAAQPGQRIPERNLHRLETWGGWAGSLAAQQIFRHKTRKATYQRTFRRIALAWIMAGVLLGGLHFAMQFYI